jgi:catechol 2,3-dioxygenase-like lactoylglutathione lyase family enzyme
MEGIIAGLLKDFEDGKMTRRQLIQSLALAATAAASSTPLLAQATQGAAQKASTIPPPTGPAPWKTVWLDHISYAVSDYRKSTAFYRDLMGWEIKNDNGTSQCTLKIGDIGEIIIRNRREPGAGDQTSTPTGQAASTSQTGTAGGNGQQGQGNRPPLTGVINHISWGVQPWNTDAVKAELEKRGLKPRPDMVGDNFKSFHVLDPDGWDLQISNQTKETRS